MKYNCEMIRDLMPLCADGIASDSSRQAVESHIQSCAECAKEWTEINGEMPVPAAEPVPAEERFQQAAKRYRKKRILWALCACAGGLILLVGFLNSPLSYGHITAGGALRAAIRQSAPLSNPSDYEIVMEKKWDRSERTLNESDVDRIFWVREKENPLSIREYGFRHGQWNLYEESMSGTVPYNTAEPLTLLNIIVCPAYNGATLLPVAVTDSNIASVRITVSGETQSAEPNEYGMCLLTYQFDTMLYVKMAQGEWQGEALDADGNVIYRMQWNEGSQAVHQRYEWISVS